MSKCPGCGAITDSKREFKKCKECNTKRYRLWCANNRARINLYYREKNKIKQIEKRLGQIQEPIQENGKTTDTI